MTTFRSDVEAIYIPRLGRAITFKDGSYSTDDPAEIQVLSGHEDVSEDVEDSLESLTRDELNERARLAGVEDPEKLPNKQAVIDAIGVPDEG